MIKIQKTDKKAASRESGFASARVKRAADTEAVSTQFPLQVEDEFNSFYEKGNARALIIKPPFVPKSLRALCLHNDILQQCLHAMEVNVDGTGHKIVLKEGQATENEKEKELAEQFFAEPYPGQSFVSIRRKLRADLEALGYAYMEVITDINGVPRMLRHLEGVLTRMCRLDDPVLVDKTVTRGGAEETVKVWTRERRYVQMVGSQSKMCYYREFGSSREIDRDTGEWAEEGKKLPLEKRGGQIIHFVVDPDINSPYGIPRWINNSPSVVGTRKAEIFNLEFFDAGGLPPILLLVEGGTFGEGVREQLLAHLRGTNSKHRAAVVDVQSSTGSIESPGKVNVKVERFGDSRQSDAMFQVYQEKGEERIRVAFRLPPIFLGKTSDYNFATAMTAYMVAEEQVFAPERKEFDEVINKTLMKALGVKNYDFKSNPVTLRNAELQLSALEIVKDKIEGEALVETVNDITGLNLEYSEEADQKAQDMAMAALMPPGAGGDDDDEEEGAGGKPPFGAKPGTPPKPGLGKPANGLPAKKWQRVRKHPTVGDIALLVDLWSNAMGLESFYPMDPVSKAQIITAVDKLSGRDRQMFDTLLTAKAFSVPAPDREGLTEITNACTQVMPAVSPQPVALKVDIDMGPVAEQIGEVVRLTQKQHADTLATVQHVLKTFTSKPPQPVEVTVKMVKEAKATRKKMLLPDGREFVLSTEVVK